MMQTTPNRIQVVDFIRGIALLGILMINIQTYSLFFFLKNPVQVFDLKWDRPGTYLPINYALHVFVKGQFFTIYSFLFGLGFYLLLEKYNRLGWNGPQLFKRRMWILLFFGLVHGLFLWSGDILHSYALLGFTLLYFNKKSVPVLLKWIAGLMIYLFIFTLVKYLFFETAEGMAQDKQGLTALLGELLRIWQHGTFFEVVGFHKVFFFLGEMMNLTSGLSWYIMYEIMFLVGLIAGKMDFLNKLPHYKPLFRRTLLYLLPIALLIKGVSCLPLIGIPLAQSPVYNEMAIILLQLVGIPLLTIGYLIVLVLIFPEQPSSLFTRIANTGRMGLTNYLAQTLICMILFYGYAGGLAGKLTLWQTGIVALLIWGVQVVYSNIWLRYFPDGPMESLWRKLMMFKKRARSKVAAV